MFPARPLYLRAVEIPHAPGDLARSTRSSDGDRDLFRAATLAPPDPPFAKSPRSLPTARARAERCAVAETAALVATHPPRRGDAGSASLSSCRVPAPAGGAPPGAGLGLTVRSPADLTDSIQPARTASTGARADPDTPVLDSSGRRRPRPTGLCPPLRPRGVAESTCTPTAFDRGPDPVPGRFPHAAPSGAACPTGLVSTPPQGRSGRSPAGTRSAAAASALARTGGRAPFLLGPGSAALRGGALESGLRLWLRWAVTPLPLFDPPRSPQRSRAHAL